ncbi:hypothetical protein LO80_03635 [Candidatus Francisella endociliophora]|uniref:Uncharacterized protein n=1 Tax=Candidatus Francisella endociliophora TaxID=653937 RepID=A0A097ENK6_9GAMM|nr:hypothetical protein [Francisella sp. FSC1006]AIT09148.1 hypothetical protein LO80_03635 [Francisella sp. FSC1006]
MCRVVSTALISCSKDNDSGISWKQTITLSGGDYGTAGPTSGGNATVGTWTLSGNSVTITCPAGYAVPITGTLPMGGNVGSPVRNNSDQDLTSGITRVSMYMFDGATRIDISSSSSVAGGSVLNAIYNAESSGGSTIVTNALCISTDNQKYFVAV